MRHLYRPNVFQRHICFCNTSGRDGQEQYAIQNLNGQAFHLEDLAATQVGLISIVGLAQSVDRPVLILYV
ncbi:MAG TPA: hypothetical protein DIS90_05310 [Cytophagales bacterium]|nr:hypothetical protein [Cytophagales bacterium]